MNSSWDKIFRGAVTPLYNSRWTISAALVVLALLIWEIVVITSLTYSRRILAQGHVVSSNHATQIVSPIAGVVSDVISPNTAVEAHQKILIVRSSQQNTAGYSSAAESLKQKSGAISKSDADLIQEVAIASQNMQKNLKSLEQERPLLIAANAARDSRIEVMTKRLEKLEAASGSFARSDIDALRLELLNEREQLARGKAELVRLEQRRQSIQEAYLQRRAEINARRQNLELNDIDVQMARNDRQHSSHATITSRDIGVITSVLVSEGQSVQEGQLLAIVDSAAPQRGGFRIQARVKPSSAGALMPGTILYAEVGSFPAREYGLFKGVVKSVNFIQPVPSANSEAAFLIEAVLEDKRITQFGREVHLRNGMSVTVEIVTDKLTLLQWLLEPVLVNFKRQSI